LRPGLRLVSAILLFVIVCYTVWDQAEQRALARDIDSIAARGEPITVGDVSGADTPERHDAARIYAAAAERYRAMPQELTFRLQRLDLDTTAQPPLDLIALERQYRPDAPALQLVDQATPLDFNGFGDVASEMGTSVMASLNFLAALRADFLSVHGKGDDAARALIPCVRLWRTVTPYLRYQVSGRILGSVRILLRHADPGAAALSELASSLAALPEDDEVAHQTMLQRARFIDSFSEPQRSVMDQLAARALRPFITRLRRQRLHSYEDALAIGRDSWPRKFVRANAVQSRLSEASGRGARRPTLLQRLVPPEGIGIMSLGTTAAGLDLAARRVLAATIAVERYRRDHAGALPSTLQALVPDYFPAVPLDPFSGDPLPYKPDPRGYLLYSIDANLRNDSGALYGLGSRRTLMPRAGEGRDLGIRVDVRR
jgi:hypothetical protein